MAPMMSHCFTLAGFAAAGAQAVTNMFSCNNNQLLGYCWTHGCTKNHEHTIVMCAHPDTGHQANSTLEKGMSGSGRMFSDGTQQTTCCNHLSFWYQHNHYPHFTCLTRGEHVMILDNTLVTLVYLLCLLAPYHIIADSGCSGNHSTLALRPRG